MASDSQEAGHIRVVGERPQRKASEYAPSPAPTHLHEPTSFLVYVVAIFKWWKWIVGGTLFAAIAVGGYTKYGCIKWYRAAAILEPTPYASINSDESAGAQQSALEMLSGGPGKEEAMGEEYITIFTSLAFTTRMAQRHHITRETLGEKHLLPRHKPDSPWVIFRGLSHRFKAQYSMRNSTVNLSYTDPDPVVAAQILTYYIDDLRDKLRAEEMQKSRAVARTLESEIRTTPDPMLAQNLYAMVARQLEHEKLAEVQADFAFKVLEPPAPPDIPYAPSTRFNTILAGVLAALFLAGLAFLYEFLGLKGFHHLLGLAAYSGSSSGAAPSI